MEDHLHEKIELNEDGQRLIRECFRQYHIIAVIWISIAVVAVYRQTVSIIQWQDLKLASWEQQFVFQFYPMIYVLQAILGIAELYFYCKAINLQKRSLDHMESSLFNQSFAAYKKGNVLGIMVMSITLICELVFLYYDARH